MALRIFLIAETVIGWSLWSHWLGWSLDLSLANWEFVPVVLTVVVLGECIDTLDDVGLSIGIDV